MDNISIIPPAKEQVKWKLMNCQRISVAVTALCCVLVFALEGCARKEVQPVQETKPQALVTLAPEIKLPPNFGIFYRSAEGISDLAKKPTLAAANPAFLIYLQKMPEAAKLRLRLGKGSGGTFILDAGTVTSSGSAETNSPPKRDNYQNILVLEYGEEAGVFEPQVTTVEGRSDVYNAAYKGNLKPGEYFAFYFVDESDGEKRWEKARFQFAGQFTVK